MKNNIIGSFIENTKNTQLGMRWLRFHTLCRLPVIGILYTAAAIAPFFNQQEISFITMLCYALNGILCLVALFPTLRLRPFAYPLSIAVSIGMAIYGLVLLSIPIVALEMIEIYYFVKRKSVFCYKK